MSVDIEKLTERDIKNYKRDIETYRKRQQMFLTLGLIFLALFIIFLAMGIVGTIFFSKEAEERTINFAFLVLMESGYSLAGLFMVGMIAMFILRGALFNGKISNRQRAIEDWEDAHKVVND